MTPEAWSLYEPFRNLRGPNESNVARHRLIDDALRATLAARADTRVIIIGAGFDTRAFRLQGGDWVELDEPALIALKEERLPAREAPNPLTRVPIAFGEESLAAALARFGDQPAPVVVLEGVFPYLSAADLRSTLDAVRTTFTSPSIVCDLTTPAFAKRQGKAIGDRLRELGAPYGRLDRDPLELFEAAGFRLTRRRSIVEAAMEFGLLPRAPRWLMATVLRRLRDGYTIATFECA